MIFKKALISICAAFFAIVLPLNADPADPEIIKRIFEQLEKLEESVNSYDFYQDSQSKELSDEGKLKKIEKRTYRTFELENDRYYELIKIDDKQLNEDEKKDEAKRRSKFIKEKKKGKKPPSDDDFKFTWQEMMEKYEFSQLPANGDAAYIITFKPRSGKLKERNRFEKIFNHLAGTAWISSDYNLIRASGYLTASVKYGLGILANVQEMQIEYAQTKIDGVWFPEMFSVHYKVRVLVKTLIREMQARYYNITKRPAATSLGSKSS